MERKGLAGLGNFLYQEYLRGCTTCTRKQNSEGVTLVHSQQQLAYVPNNVHPTNTTYISCKMNQVMFK